MVESAPKISEEEMQMIYNWVDEIPLSRPKRNIARDFSDGGKYIIPQPKSNYPLIVLVAEIVKHFVPHIVELHNYSAAHSVSQKTYNWNTLNQKIFKKLGFSLVKKDMEDAVNCAPDTIERILRLLQINLGSYQERKTKKMMMAKAGGTGSGSDGEFENHVQTFAPHGNKENQQTQYHQQQHIAGGKGPQQQQNMMDQELLVEKDQTIQQLKETIEILELKVKKLEQLVKLKDAKILNLSNKLQTAGIMQ